MKITLEINKSVEENAQTYFEKSKKAKKKIDGVKQAIELYTKKLAELKEKQAHDIQKHEKTKEERAKKSARKKEWYEKFRWFHSSTGFLCISGMDATSNEIVVKKHMDDTDLVLHAELAGSPFTIVKAEGKEIDEVTKTEAALFTAVYSRAWRQGLGAIEVFWVLPEQVSKTANPGESLAKGSFMIRGKVNYIIPDMEVCIGLDENDRVVAGAETAMYVHAQKYVKLIQGQEKTSDMAKHLKKLLGGGELDDFSRFIPTGGTKVRGSVIEKK